MSAEYKIFGPLRLKYVTISGVTQLSELRSLAETYLEDPLFSPHHRQFIDLANLTDAKAGFSDVFTLRNFYLRAYGKKCTAVPVAIYAPTDMGYGLSRMFASLMVGQDLMRIKIFENFSEALSWLEIDENDQAWKEREFLSVSNTS